MARKTTSLKIDEELWKKFKIKCIMDDQDISDAVEELIKKEAKR